MACKRPGMHSALVDAVVFQKSLRPDVVRGAIAAFKEVETQGMGWSIPDDLDVSKLGHLVHKLKAKDNTGRWAYYFVLVPRENENRFMSAIDGSGMINLEDHGEVIASCYGEYPSVEVAKFLKNKYGFNVEAGPPEAEIRPSLPAMQELAPEPKLFHPPILPKMMPQPQPARLDFPTAVPTSFPMAGTQPRLSPMQRAAQQEAMRRAMLRQLYAQGQKRWEEFEAGKSQEDNGFRGLGGALARLFRRK